MTREEHYAEAERLLDLAQMEARAAGRGPVSDSRMEYLMKRAQVHATLACAERGIA